MAELTSGQSVKLATFSTVIVLKCTDGFRSIDLL